MFIFLGSHFDSRILCAQLCLRAYHRPRVSSISATGQLNFGHGSNNFGHGSAQSATGQLKFGHGSEDFRPRVSEMALSRDNLLLARSYLVPAFDTKAQGTPYDWNEKIDYGNGGRKFLKALYYKGLKADGTPDIAAVVDFLRARKDKHGQSIDNKLGTPESMENGWYRMEYLSQRDLFTASGRCRSWETAWHGSEQFNH